MSEEPVEVTSQMIETYVAAHEEFMKVTENLFNGIAEEISNMPNGPQKMFLLAFLGKHMSEYKRQCQFLMTLYNPGAVRGEESE